MQTWRLPLLLLGACALLLVFIVYFERELPSSSDRTHLKKRLYPAFDPKTAHCVSIRIRRSDEVRLVLRDDKWRIVEPFEFAADQFTVDDLLWSIADLEFIQKIPVSRQSARLKEYGLHEPRIVLRVNWGKKDEAELRLGIDSPRPGAVYAQIRKNDKFVYVIPQEIFSLLSQPVDEWRNKSLVDLAGQKVHVIILEEKGFRYEFHKTDQSWKLITPETRDVVSEKVNFWLSSLFSARAVGYCNQDTQDAVRRISPEMLVGLELYNEKKELLAGLRFAEVKISETCVQPVARRVGESVWMCLAENQLRVLLPQIDFFLTN